MKISAKGLIIALSLLHTVAHGATNIGYFGQFHQVTINSGNSPFSPGIIQVGYNGHDNDLTINSGGSVSSSNSFVGLFTGYSNTASVSGSNSQWNVSGDLFVGSSGNNNSMTINSGALVTSGSGNIGFAGTGPYSANFNSMVVTGSGSQWLNSGDLYVGYSTPSLNFALNNSLSVQDGAMARNGAAYVHEANTVNVSGTDSVWQNQGVVTVEGVVNVQSGGELIAESGLAVSGGSSAVNIMANGRLTVGSDFDGSVTNIIFSAGSSLAVSGNVTGLTEVNFNTRLEAASILGDLTVNGTLAPGSSPAASTISGSLVMGANGVLEMEIGGPLAGIDSDHLTVVNSATLDGTLEIKLINGLAVQNGDSFDLFDWQDWVSGTFLDVDTPLLGGGLSWDASQLYTTGQLNVVPEPAVMSLMLLAGSTLLINKRMRKG